MKAQSEQPARLLENPIMRLEIIKPTKRVKGRDYPGDKNEPCGCGIFEDLRGDEDTELSTPPTESFVSQEC